MLIEPREVHLVKKVPGLRYHKRGDDHASREHFYGYLSWATCVALRGVFGDGLRVGPALTAWARAELRDRITPSLLLRDQLEPADGVYDVEGLRPHQETGARFLLVARRAIVADETRTGKMVMGADALRRADPDRALIVCPNSLKLEWQQHLERWWPGSRPVVVSGSAKKRRDALAAFAAGEHRAAIINWEGLRGHTRLARYGSAVTLARCERCGGDAREASCEVHARELNDVPPGAVILDEAHRAKDPRAKQTRAAWAVAEPAEYVWAMTGTPADESPEDLWALGHLVAPHEWPVKSGFLERYAFTGWNTFGGMEVLGLRADTKAELFSILDPRFLRRTRELVLPWLPKKTYERRNVELPAKQRRLYDEMADAMLAELEGGMLVVTNPLAKITRLRQFAAAFAHLEPAPCSACRGSGRCAKCGGAGNCDKCGGSAVCVKCDGSGEGTRVVLEEPSEKLDELDRLLEDLPGPVVIAAESRQLIDLLAARLEKRDVEHGLIVGGMTDEAKQSAKDRFQAGALRALLITIGTGGEGLTLHRADNLVMLQRPYSRIKNTQMEDRIVGDGKANVIELIAVDTVEERVLEIIAEKGELSEEIVRDAETFRRLVGGDR